MFLPYPDTGASYVHLSFAIKYAKNMRPRQKTKWIQTCFLENAYNATTKEILDSLHIYCCLKKMRLFGMSKPYENMQNHKAVSPG